MFVIVVGTARSGTCWVGRLLAQHPEFTATVEGQPMFRLATQLAKKPSQKATLWPELVGVYRKKLADAGSRGLHYADKSHPLLWYWRELSEEFDVRFWWPRRNCYDAVRSMLNHVGCTHHALKAWEGMDQPNRFLGIGPNQRRRYAQLPAAARHALRWASHEAEGQRLLRARPDTVCTDYDELVADQQHVLSRVQHQLGLEQSFRGPASTSGTPHCPLDPQQQDQIDKAIEGFKSWW